jgi:hypothetical protein
VSARIGDGKPKCPRPHFRRRFLRVACALRLALALLGAGPDAARAEPAPAPLPNPREWAKRLPGGNSIEGAIARTAGAWPIVLYWVESSGRATPKVRLPRLTPGAWDGRGLTRPVDLTALDYALRLNPGLAADADRGTLARRMMLLSRARLALDLGGTGDKGGDMWTLWTLAGEEAAVIHRSKTGSDRSPTAVAAFVRAALGFDGIILDSDGDYLLARVAAHATTVDQTGLVLADSAMPLRIADERERSVTALVRVVAVDGSWALLRLLAAPRLGIFPAGTKLVLERPKGAPSLAR